MCFTDGYGVDILQEATDSSRIYTLEEADSESEDWKVIHQS